MEEKAYSEDEGSGNDETFALVKSRSDTDTDPRSGPYLVFSAHDAGPVKGTSPDKVIGLWLARYADGEPRISITSTTRTTVCGYQALAFTGTAPPSVTPPSTVQGVIAAIPRNGAFKVAVVFTGSPDPDDPDYQHDARTILDNLQIKTA